MFLFPIAANAASLRRAGTAPAVARNWFEGDGPLPDPDDPVFFLLYPSDDAARRMAALGTRLRHRQQLLGEPAATDRLHVSLYFVCRFGRLTDRVFTAIRQAAADVKMPPFLAEFDRVLNFGREAGHLVLCGDEGVTGIGMLRDELVAAAVRVGFPCDTRAHTPHVTLNYGKCRVPEHAVPAIRWTVDELVLVCSLRGRQRHRVLGRWRLRPRSTAPAL
jgi:RNA 2',3'-cyclic 3'-phosphodiesterase